MIDNEVLYENLRKKFKKRGRKKLTKVRERVEFSARQHGDGQKALLKQARVSGRGVAAWEEYREVPIRRFSRDDYRTYRRVD